MIQLRIDVGLNQSHHFGSGGAKWLNYGYLECRARGFEDRLETGCESKSQRSLQESQGSLQGCYFLIVFLCFSLSEPLL